MVAEIKAWRTDEGYVFDSEAKARRHELKQVFITVIGECGVAYSDAESVAHKFLNSNFELLYERVVAYKKTLPACAFAKEDKENGNE